MNNKFKNVTLIPGWPGKVAYYKNYSGLEVWKGWHFPPENANTEWIVAHSLGAHFALQKWQKDNNKKFILVNPLLAPKKIINRIVDWIKFIFKEKFFGFNPNILFLSLPFAIRKFFILDKISLLDILKSLPKENLTILRGRQDVFFCNEDCVILAKECGLKLIEVNEAGHDWNKKFDEIINKIVNS